MITIKELVTDAKKIFARVALFSFFTNILALTLPIYMLQIYDRILPTKSEASLLYLTIIAFGIMIIYSIFHIIQRKFLDLLSFWVEHELSITTLMRAADDVLHGDEESSSILSYTTHLRNYVSSGAFLIVFDLPWTPIYIMVLWFLHDWIGWFAVIGSVLLFCLAVLNDRYTRSLYKTANLTQAAGQVNISGILKNADTIQAMGMGDAMLEQWGLFHQKTQEILKRANHRSSIISSCSKGLRILLQILILGLGAYLVIHDEFSSGMMIAACIIMSRAVAPIEQSIGAWRELVKAKQEYNAIKQYISKPERRAMMMDLPAPKGEIECDHLYFRYPAMHEWTLADLHFKIHSGEILVIAGPSASGKSTLLRLLVGALSPTQGHIRLDNAEVYHWNRKQFGQYVGYMAQSIELFNATVMSNIAHMEMPDPEKVIQAAQWAGAHDLILKLPSEYNTVVGDQGKNVSGGQRQYIALARSLYHHPKILVLDEPTSFMDEKSQRDFIKIIHSLKSQGVCIIIVTHKPMLIQASDKLLFLQNGKILSYGPTVNVVQQLKKLSEGSGDKK